MDDHDLGLGHDLRVMSRRRILGMIGAASRFGLTEQTVAGLLAAKAKK